MNEQLRICFHDKFKKFMKLKGVTQSDISRDLNISLTTISGWYHGKTFPRPDKMQLLADYFNVPVESLIMEDDSAFIPLNSLKVSHKSSEEQQYLNKLIFNPINWNIEEKIDGNYLLSNLKTNATCEITQSQLDYLLEQFIIKNIDVMKNFIYDLTCGDLDDLDEDNSFSL